MLLRTVAKPQMLVALIGRRGNVQMKLNICLMSALFLAVAVSGVIRDARSADVPQVDLAAWAPPQLRAVGDDPFGKLVKYGYALMVDTANRIGPAAADPAKRDLLAKKEALEQKIDKLKYEKAAMPEDEYKNQLTAALVELARVQQELEK